MISENFLLVSTNKPIELTALSEIRSIALEAISIKLILKVLENEETAKHAVSVDS